MVKGEKQSHLGFVLFNSFLLVFRKFSKVEKSSEKINQSSRNFCQKVKKNKKSSQSSARYIKIRKSIKICKKEDKFMKRKLNRTNS